ncbi:MAG: AcrR family transcriptional regulator [Crocinitomix sp.]|jgi:AcrR family transcriptional regulator
MEEKKMEIVKSALEVYMKFGIKSVTMDEMARQLGVSKKTLYLHVRDKNELVEQCLLLDHDCAIEGMDDIFAQEFNAIEELLEIGRYMVKTLGSIHPSIFFDLRKYHPNALKMSQTHKYDAMRKRIVDNLNKGMNQGVYRDNLTPDILSRLHMGTIDMVMSGEVVPSTEFRVDEVYSEFFRYHIRGIASNKGLECLKELIRNDENL